MRQLYHKLHSLFNRQPDFCNYTLLALTITGSVAYGLLLVAGILEWIDIPASRYWVGIALQRGALEQIPAVMLAGLIPAAIGDWLVLHQDE